MRELKTQEQEAPATPWRVPVAIDDVADAGQHFEITADEHVRTALAQMAGLRDLRRLEASFDVSRHGSGGLRVVGHISATVVQNCVVTLEPLDNEVEEEIDLLFVPPTDADGQAAEAAGLHEGTRSSDAWHTERPGKKGLTYREKRSDKLSERQLNEPERLLGGQVDLGALASEFLMLGLNPYPRTPGAVFQPPQDVKPDGGPFAALARLTKDRHDR